MSLNNIKHIAINPKSQQLLHQLLSENPMLKKILHESANENEVMEKIQKWVLTVLSLTSSALDFYKGKETGRQAFEALEWQDYAAIRLLDYIDHSNQTYEDPNLRGEAIMNHPFKILWDAVKSGTGGGAPAFFMDMIHLFRQFTGQSLKTKPSVHQVTEWMDRFPSGLDPDIVSLRQDRQEKILLKIIEKINNGQVSDKRYSFEPGMSEQDKLNKAKEWWNEYSFLYKFAVRHPDDLNHFLDNSLDPDTLAVLHDAYQAGIPTFVNPYYLSLLLIKQPNEFKASDQAIRDYIIFSKQLVNEFGHISAWEKEDIVEPGKPNAAGWLLPTHHNIHRRYPEVAVLIPDTMGRACGGLCSSCQRMFDFQNGVLNFDLDKLKSKETWKEKLAKLMAYFENDSQLRDILITGGDALMSSDKSLKTIFDQIYQMALRKKEANAKRKEGEKYAEMVRIRLGTRLPVYMPQRVTEDLMAILADFKSKASEAGVKQFVIQTHFESPMEVTPEAQKAVQRFLKAGWIVTNQLVFTASASRRGHTAKLRKTLNDIGVLTYYTFTVKGYMENNHNFAPNARCMQEQIEEKPIGTIPSQEFDTISQFPMDSENLLNNMNHLRQKLAIPFLATDRNVLNLPGVGKSLTYRVIGITHDGRRILRFDHDATRRHSPIIHSMGKVFIIESKSILDYINQMDCLGENTQEYESIYGYSIGETEPRMAIYEYPAYDFATTDHMTNLQID